LETLRLIKKSYEEDFKKGRLEPTEEVERSVREAKEKADQVTLHFHTQSRALKSLLGQSLKRVFYNFKDVCRSVGS